MTNRLFSVLAAGLLVAPTALSAQQIGGEYQVEVRGMTVHLDRKPVTRQLRDNTVLTIKQAGDVITLEFRTFASAMSTTVFQGRVGNNRFVALWTSPAHPGEALFIHGEVEGNRLRGRLLYPRATAAAAVPGWTDVEFAAARRSRGAQGTTGTKKESAPAADGRPNLGRLPVRGQVAARPSTGAGHTGEAAPATAFDVDLLAMTEPEAPLAGHRIEFLARGTPVSRGESVARMELWINGLVQGSSDGNVLEVEAGPFDAGMLSYEIVAVADDGRRSRPISNDVRIQAAGSSTITGRINGNRGAIADVQLMRADVSVARSPLDGSGHFRITGVPAGDYLIFVNDGKAEAYVSPSSNLEIEVDGRSTYTRNFEVR